MHSLTNKQLRLVLGLPLLAAVAVSCTSGEGALTIKISGEEAAQSGYPVGSGDDQIAFEDGWTLEFSKVLVALADFELKTAQGDEATLDADPIVADLHTGEPQLWKFAAVPAQRWDRVGYRYAPPTDATRHADEVSASDVALMHNEGYSFYIEGTAHKDNKQVAIAWGFPFTVQLTHCENGVDNTDGLVVLDRVENSAQITVHLDHLFFDQWVTTDQHLRFDAMAAVAPADGPLTLKDLAQQDNLSRLQGADGKPLGLAYDPGSTFKPVPKNLEEYVIDAATTTGHWNGEGHCVYTRL
ncbi:MAG: hypothetical protein RL701_7174 [Pseudomonadota bacterium]